MVFGEWRFLFRREIQIRKKFWTVKADICVTSVAITSDRADFVDFLPPLQTFVAGIYIPTSNSERIDFKTYLTPFTVCLWMILMIIGKDLFDWRHNPSHLTLYPDVLKIKTYNCCKTIFCRNAICLINTNYKSMIWPPWCQDVQAAE